QALHLTSRAHDYPFRILEAVMEVNRRQKHILSKKIIDYFGGNLAGRKIAVWGLAFKPNTDDVREAPAMDIIRDLLDTGAQIAATDPGAIPNFSRYFDGPVEYSEDQYAILQDADALAIVTEWGEFRTPGFRQIRSAMKAPVIFDGRNIYDLEDLPDDFYYASIGRDIHHPKS